MNKSLLERALGRINALTPEELEKKLIANGIKFNRIQNQNSLDVGASDSFKLPERTYRKG